MSMNDVERTGYYTTPHTNRAYHSTNRAVGLGGMWLPLALSPRWGIPDELFWKRVAQFRLEPRVPPALVYAQAAGDLALLPALFDMWRRGSLPGAPDANLGVLSGLADWRQLWPQLPVYALPACDAVSVEHFVSLVNGLAAGIVSPPELRAVMVADGAPRRRAEYVPPAPASGRVTAEHVIEFAEYYGELGSALMDAIAWDRIGWRRSAPADTANAIAREILGIPVDLRMGALVRAAEVTSVTRLAAGHANFAGDDSDAARLRAFVSRMVPRVRPQTAGSAGVFRCSLGAAWSVALDQALNSPAVWCRDANDELPRAGSKHLARA